VARSGNAERSHSLSHSAAAVCKYFKAEAIQFRIENIYPDETGGKEMCFDDCKPEQVPVSQFWGTLDAEESRAIKENLIDYEGFYTVVTKVDLGGDPGKQFRLVRRVGSAHCQRDTYLEQTPAGFRQIDSPVLNQFSVEAGPSCGAGAIYFSPYQGKPYAISTYNHQLDAYRIDPGVKLTKTCSTRFN